MKVSEQLYRVRSLFQSVPKKYYAFTGIGIVVLLYGVAFFIPKSVVFSYAGETCVKQLTLAPNIHKSHGGNFTVGFYDTWTIGSVPIVAMKSCFMPTTAPKTGSVASAPFGAPIFKKQFAVAVSEPPSIVMTTAPIPTTKPYAIAMTATDRIYKYSMVVADTSANCISSDKSISCDVPQLKLVQGKEYDYTLMRTFKDETPKEVQRAKLTTLKAVEIKKSSIKASQTIYSKPKTFEFTLDKVARGATVKLLNGKKEIPVTVDVDGKVIAVRPKDELAREASYALTISSVDADDGSTLLEPYTTNFSVSGGPKVTNVSVGQSGVTQSSSIVLTFDQKLSDKQDTASLAVFTGGSASVQKINATQLRIQLNNLPLCQAFSVSMPKGILSAYDIKSTKDWSFSSRTTCYTTTQYGTSVNGRPLIAYIFGSSGPTTMYVGTIHGNESSSSGMMRAWVNELEANPSRVQGKRIVVIPTINPDGLAANTRMNARKVNLNRNFPTDNWTSDINDTDGKHKAGGGKKPLSEPEAAALASFTQQTRPKLLLSFHAIGSLTSGDPGGYSAPFAAKYASMVGYRDATNSTSNTFDYDITGSYEDWTYRNQGIPSIVIELGSYGYYSISHHRSALWTMVQ